MTYPNERSLLLIGHPGHELRVLGWLAQARPLVCILTDGSGSDNVPRLAESLAVLREMGAPTGAICGQFSDRRIYQHVLDGEQWVFTALRDRLTDLLVEGGFDTVVSDGIEGYNPTHDLCHALAGSAAVAAAMRRGSSVSHLCIPLMGDPGSFADGASPVLRQTVLDQDSFDRKMQIIHKYAQSSGPTLQREVQETLQKFGVDAFRHERLFDGARPSRSDWNARFVEEHPYYETYGRAQVAAGRYEFVISFQQHMRPLVDRLYLDVADKVATEVAGLA
jgi:hypothetical protein